MSGLRNWLSRRQIACAGFAVYALAFVTTPTFAQNFDPPNPPLDYTALELPACGKPSQQMKVVLDTMKPPGANDQHWVVTGPGISSPIAPYHATLSAWTALSGSWVEPTNPGLNYAADSAPSGGDYTYTIWFRLRCPPESYSNLQLTGTFAADNNATIYLNSFPLTSCTNNLCFQGAGIPFTATAPFYSGLNSLSVVVHNSGKSYTGASVSAEVSGTCIDKTCVKQSGLLKVCKVAGVGVPLGTPSSFVAGGSNPFTVPAGPTPGGTCVIGPRFPTGMQVNVKEVGPAGYSVSSITVTPPLPPVTPNLGVGGNVTVTMGNGVTEVTFTDKHTRVGKTGFLEICKTGDVKGNYSFMVSPGALGPFVVPAGACSPAIEVPAGTVDIKEMLNRGTAMLGCATMPANNQISCDPIVTGTSTVTVLPSSGSASTIAFISDRPIDDTEPGPPGPPNPTGLQYQQQ